MAKFVKFSLMRCLRSNHGEITFALSSRPCPVPICRFAAGRWNLSMQSRDDILADILLENEGTFQTFLRLVTPIQTKVLHAVAAEGTIKEIQGKAFLTKYQLGAASTAKTAVKSLVEKELLLDNNGEYQIYDRFFGQWLV